jgi:hypothetical protein
MALFVLITLHTTLPAGAQSPAHLKNARILLYTKNGKGYVHDNIPNSIIAIKELGERHGFLVDATEDPAVFTDENLKIPCTGFFEYQ